MLVQLSQDPSACPPPSCHQELWMSAVLSTQHLTLPSMPTGVWVEGMPWEGPRVG